MMMMMMVVLVVGGNDDDGDAYSSRQCNYYITALKNSCMAGRNFGISYILHNFAHICCRSSSHCGLPALKLNLLLPGSSRFVALQVIRGSLVSVAHMFYL